MNHYFNSNENLQHKETEIEYVHEFIKFNFITDAGVFSRGGVDYATNILLGNLPVLSGKTLDLGCGYGCIGIVLAKIYVKNIDVTMSDVNERALDLCAKNSNKNDISVKIIKSEGFKNIPDKFDNIILNPPIHAGKPVIYNIYSEAFYHLNENGRFYIVIQKKHGALSHKEKLKEIFGNENCFVLYSKKGFFIFEIRFSA
ncbi:MAG: methyltransferase [Oscillospiraceae bacterium]|nr:methyltransferase [Oscillospiraceae bacterium]